ncbi:hypothetical protein [Escherichia coli]|nr:hypothetical protein [Escherichia coli]EEC8200344.1 hypothetical protein [Escherichia coli]EEC8438718.1 hypothetical protein [Escherichia coli]EEC8786917.1 hypothetical protein [Escherichia coli]EEC8878462.1 hypothetical protein [Escherichia coli]EEQ1570428.1 hypothetical protein [Escherichia coli]
MNTKEKYLSFAEYAASLEKSGYYAEAIDEWEKAYSYAVVRMFPGARQE